MDPGTDTSKAPADAVADGAAPSEADAAAAAQQRAISEARRTQFRLKKLRAMSTFEYIGMQAAETLAFCTINAPPILGAFFISGTIRARFPSQVPGMPPTPVPQTFGGLLSAGIKNSFKSTLRFSAWNLGSVVLAALTREVAKVGPRWKDLDPRERTSFWMGPEGMVINASVGLGVAYAILGSSMGDMPRRRLLYSVYGGVGGIAMPVIMAIMGPGTNARMQKVLANMGVQQQGQGQGPRDDIR